MRANGSSANSIPISVQHQSELVFDRMNRYLGRLAKDAKAADVHRFRTNSRRVEALVSELAPETSNQKKLLKALSKLRKKAGKVRDLDVQIAFLKELKIPDRQNHRAQLLEALAEEQGRRSKKLTKYFDGDRVRQLRKRLRKAQSELALEGIDPLKLAVAHLPKPAQIPVTEKTLHACRIAAKRARYLAELVADSPEAKIFLTELKRAQDEIGRWHDVLKLTERAEKLFGGVRDSALVSALQNVSHAKFRRAGHALHYALRAISGLQQGTVPHPARRKSDMEPAVADQSVAA
jgi:CHAD domain-containing protein